jgi:alpha-L-arabinofuranosidase
VIDPGGGWIERLISAEVVTGPDAKSANTFEQPQVVTRQPLGAVRVEGGKAYLTLPRLSAAGISLRMRYDYSS